MKRSRLLGLTLAALMVLVFTSIAGTPRAQAETMRDVTVTIVRVQEIHCDEDGPFEVCPNDYYPKVYIDRQDPQGEEKCCVEPGGDPPAFLPHNWRFTRTAKDSSGDLVPIHLELWDDDDGSDDNIIDIASGDPRPLDLTFNLATCTFEGGGLTKQQGAGVPGLLQGQSLGGPDESAWITFTITTPFCIEQAYKLDSDNDGLFNAWEIRGLNVDVKGNVMPVLDDTPDLALNLPPFNANPNRKDLFVEVDWMDCKVGGCEGLAQQHSHKPADGALQDVVDVFKNAPVENPDDSLGITLHAMLDEAVPDWGRLRFDSTEEGTRNDFDDIKLGNPPDPCKTGKFGTPADRASPNCANILAAKRHVFRYMIFGHSIIPADDPTNDRSSGQAELGFLDGNIPVGGNDFIVTLHNFSPDTINDMGGQRVAEASTFLHEIGHALGLDHGGGDEINCKPNYLSVMNYTLQFPIRDPSRPLDYSSAALGTLNEKGGLDETKGIGGPANRQTLYGVGGKLRTRPANSASIDWNEKDGLEKDATADINFISSIRPSSDRGGCSTPSADQELHGYDDWQHIVYSFRDSPFFADGAHGPSLPELTADTIMAMSAQADLTVAKLVDKPIAVGGDTLNYSVPVTNVGRGKATGVTLTDTLPDGSTQTRALPDLDAGASNTQTFTYVVPCATVDGTLLTNQASVAGTDQSGIPDPDLSDNTAQASTTVHAPKLTLSQSATASVNAGEAIVYTITYENTGGAAANVVITEVLPAGIYYSKALDLGAGPKPGSVTLNADGTQTLVWNIAAVPAGSGPQTIVFTARPTLLALGGASYGSTVSLSFQNSNGCGYDALSASASTNITVLPPTRDPLTLGFWRTHPEVWTAEMLARIQATDQRYDADGDGMLSPAEATAILAPGGNQPRILQMQLLASYFNLATRRINAGTTISSKTADSRGLASVRDAALFARGTLLLPVNSTNAAQYDDATRVLDEINNNRSEVY
jgi:uncharacterized repeat protein (TIGR01451 family)